MKALRTGQTLELEIENTSPPVKLKATVQNAQLGEYELTLNDLTLPPELVPGRELQVRYCTPAGFHEATTKVVQVRPTMSTQLIVEFFQAERCRQRRAFFRTSAYLPCEVSVLVSKKIKAGEADRRATTLDISGGGVKLETSLALIPEDRVGIVVRVPQKLQPALPPVLVVEAKVVRVVEVIRQGRDLYQVAASFEFKREVERDPWVHLTMDIERGLDKESPKDEEDG